MCYCFLNGQRFGIWKLPFDIIAAVAEPSNDNFFYFLFRFSLGGCVEFVCGAKRVQKISHHSPLKKLNSISVSCITWPCTSCSFCWWWLKRKRRRRRKRGRVVIFFASLRRMIKRAVKNIARRGHAILVYMLDAVVPCAHVISDMNVSAQYMSRMWNETHDFPRGIAQLISW